eukprot:TRINITY_DN67899_c4_g7_i1.p1 TRINITY_DN67899_c4_g7~~TRINITY_DN67899_c4_g7_i1.p1  ORF type:complete len:113 (-),score=6.61 TRINITY_DN67899_c4_g7_i1:183-521(-)
MAGGQHRSKRRNGESFKIHGCGHHGLPAWCCTHTHTVSPNFARLHGTLSGLPRTCCSCSSNCKLALGTFAVSSLVGGITWALRLDTKWAVLSPCWSAWTEEPAPETRPLKNI